MNYSVPSASFVLLHFLQSCPQPIIQSESTPSRQFVNQRIFSISKDSSECLSALKHLIIVF